MNIQEFFELFEGQWFSQRTLHHIQTEKTDVGKAELWIEKVEPNSSAVIEACQQFKLPTDQVICPLEITYKATLASGRSQIASTLMVPVSTADNTGQLISAPQQGSAVLGTYTLGTDEVLTFSHFQDNGKIIERIWYASENLRLRSITQSQADGTTEANFCSEIRRMGAPQEKPSETQAQQSLSPLAAWRARHNQT